MLYWRYAPNKILFINEYWVFVPSMVLIDYFIIKKMKINERKTGELKKLKEQIEHERSLRKKIRKVLYVSLGYNFWSILMGGTESLDLINALVDTEYITCNVNPGIRWLDDVSLKNLIKTLYKHKHQEKIIYITATALCHVSELYGRQFLDLPFTIVPGLGSFSFYQTLRKLMVTILTGFLVPLGLGGSPVTAFSAALIGTLAIKLGFNNLDYIPTSAIDFNGDIRTRIPNVYDVIVLNNKDKITMTNPMEERRECWLAGQPFFNPKCKKSTQILPCEVDSILDGIVTYDGSVNMKDVTGLDRVEFTDRLNLGQIESPACGIQKSKQVNFLDKFGDSKSVHASGEGWNIYDNEIASAKEKYSIKAKPKP